MDFEQDDSSFTTRELTYPIGCSAVKQSDIVIIDGRPCKVMEISTETGEDGEEKIHIKGEDIFNGDNHDDFCSLTEMITIAVVSDKEYELVSIEEGYCVLMDDKGETRVDIRLPAGELGTNLQKFLDELKTISVTVLSALGEEEIVRCKTYS